METLLQITQDAGDVGTLDSYIKYAITVGITAGIAWLHRTITLRRMKKKGKLKD